MEEEEERERTKRKEEEEGEERGERDAYDLQPNPPSGALFYSLHSLLISLLRLKNQRSFSTSLMLKREASNSGEKRIDWRKSSGKGANDCADSDLMIF